MKKLFVFVALSFVASVAFSQDVPLGAVLLGERRVDFHADHDVIQVGVYEGWFKDIVFWVEKNDLEMFNLVVTYANGEREKFDTRLIFDPGTRSRVIHLQGRRHIKNIAFTFKTVGSWFEGRAHIVVYGIR